MNNKLQSLARMTNTSHVFTVLILSAVGAVFLLPLSAHQNVTPSATAQTALSTSLITVPTIPAVTATVATTTPTTTTSTAPPPPPTPTTTPVPPPAAPRPSSLVAAPVTPSGYGCTPALAYLQAHAAPGFVFECPGWAQGHQAMTCVNVAGVCPGTKVIAISTPCPAAYMNEASNSWVVLGESRAGIDPYGYCH